ncbi:phenylacetate--CoA ligase [Desulfovibrio sulfodismutans]|uniref:Phenylacetate-coenzyme A ligase n=1 Tax=Desulfolutivibrio sulfodismutans TaxID=63561 RepID=A0A7K3NR67_9BACT|nr:phenylacetate--CoA ligase [Desulfolutivibrio sulfodismutans]NDY58694.1 phenylacetate--CoA ligase [Desulfolutivibrio sulfodismutans]QLA11345.1 AMP-binding protein [Desulfolutivibrio sulfodismutans DSM 3696]
MLYDDAEKWSREEIEKAQIERLRRSLQQAAASRFYGALFREHGVNPDAVRGLDDVRRLPFTTKKDLREAYPDGLLAMPHADMVRMHVSSGTTGAPTVIYHTKNDLDWWASLMARCMHMVGIRPTDVFQNMSGYGLFTGGLGIHYGAERLGCLTIPAGAGNTKRQIKLITDFNVTAVHIIPSYALHLANVLRDMGVDPASLPIRFALVGAEPYTEAARRRLEEMFDMKVYNSYGLSEMNGPGVAFECTEQHGMHLWEDAYIAEIVDPETGEPVPEGELGELVMTTLGREGMPVIRYRTRDLTRFLPGPCPCGRVHRRIDRIAGRCDDMIIIKGVNIYPMQVEAILMAMPEVGQNYLIELDRVGVMDQITIKVEVKEEFFVEDMRALTGLQKRITSRLRDEILVTPRVELVEAKSLPQGEGKAKRVVDKRGTDS